MLRARRLLIFAALTAVHPVHAEHACDALGEAGWRVVPTRETVDVKDGAPYQADNGWFIERTTTVLPMCNYINASGSYSLLSYSLSPETRTERVAICKNAPGSSSPVAPYGGPCPPQ